MFCLQSFLLCSLFSLPVYWMCTMVMFSIALLGCSCWWNFLLSFPVYVKTYHGFVLSYFYLKHNGCSVIRCVSCINFNGCLKTWSFNSLVCLISDKIISQLLWLLSLTTCSFAMRVFLANNLNGSHLAAHNHYYYCNHYHCPERHCFMACFMCSVESSQVKQIHRDQMCLVVAS